MQTLERKNNVMVVAGDRVECRHHVQDRYVSLRLAGEPIGFAERHGRAWRMTLTTSRHHGITPTQGTLEEIAAAILVAKKQRAG